MNVDTGELIRNFDPIGFDKKYDEMNREERRKAASEQNEVFLRAMQENERLEEQEKKKLNREMDRFELVPKELNPMANQLLGSEDSVFVPHKHPLKKYMKKVVKHRKKMVKKSKARNRGK